VFSQSKTSTLEDKIYNAIDAFVVNPNEKALGKLEFQEKDFNAKSKPELLALVILNCNKAYYQNQFGQTQKAIKSYEKAWQLFEKNKLSNYDITESCLKPLGNLYTIIGDYGNAENVIKQYYFIANTENNQQQKYAAILNLSNVYQNTGKLNEAIDLLEKTIAHDKLTNVQKGILYTNLGNNYFLSTESFVINGNPFMKGEDAYKKAILLLKSEKNQAETLSIAYRNLAKRYAVTQEYELANANMGKAKTTFELIPNLEPRKKAQFYLDEAILQFKQKKITEASQSLTIVFKIMIPDYARSKTLLPNKDSLYAETVLLDALDLQSEISLAVNQPKKALESYTLSFHIEELLQSLLVYENSKIITLIRNRNRTEKCLEIYNSLYLQEKKISYIESAFLLAEQTKSAVLKQALSHSKINSREEKLILIQLQNWNTIIVKEQQKIEKADISKINEAIKKQNELMLLLKSEQSRTGKSVEKELKIPDLYTKLEKDKAVLLEYFMGSKNIYIFTLNKGKIKLESVSNEDTATPKLVQFIDFFNNSKTISDNPSGFNHFSNVAYNVLKLPGKSQNENLIIIPDGILTFIPFEALISEESNTTNFAKMHYLLNDFKIGYSNSAYFYLNAIPFQHQKEGVLGVFPVFEGTKFELAFSKKELQNLQGNFKGKYLSNQNASFKNFKANAHNYSIIHLSTHASSGDILEPASIKFYDQEVLYSEFYNLDLNPDLVVLSACETGIGKLYKAEGAMSVARGFQFAGVQNLLFSLWKVNDFTTSVLMQKFYANVKKGHSYFDSNHQAKLDFLADESIPNAKKSPYYWSSFVYYGTLENPSKTNYFLWISLLTGLIGLLLLWKLAFRKK
jgi:CHAT domain-containing protein